MASIAEQLAAAPVTDALKYETTVLAEAAGWKKLVWATGVGTWGTSGWKPPGYIKHEPDGSNGGDWLSGKKLTGGSAFAYVQSPTFGASQAGGGVEYRQRSVWLFSTGEGAANGYQVTAKDTTAGASTKYLLRLAKYVAGAQTVLGSEVEVEIEANGAIAVVATGGRVSAWVRGTEGGAWSMVTEATDSTFTEGFSGIDGNGSNPTIVNLSTGTLTPEQSSFGAASTPALPLQAPSAGGRDAPRLAATVTTNDGQSYVVGPDEAEPDRAAVQIDFNTELSGGFGPATVTVALPPGSPQPDRWLLAGVRVHDADTDAGYYEGRITNVSSSDGQVQLQTEGWAKHLADDETAMEIFIDRDLSKWGEPSTPRKSAVLGAGYEYGHTSIETTPGGTGLGPALVVKISQWLETPHPIAEAWYYGGGVDIGKLIYDFYVLKAAGTESLSHNAYISVNDGGGTNIANSETYKNANKLVQTLEAANAGGKYAFTQFIWSLTGSGTNGGDSWAWINMAVIGRHGLAIHGTWPGQGFYTSDMAKYVVKKFAPLLSTGLVEQTAFVVPHAAWTEPTTAQAMIEAFAPFGGQGAQPLVWGVYDRRQFFMAEPGAFGRTWRVRHDQTAQSQNQGADASERINGVKVTYDDGTGRKQSVGPPGSGATTETSRMEDRSPSNPANFDGARHWRQYDAGIMNQAQAELVGGLVLAQAATVRWRGSVSVQGWAEAEGGEVMPAALMRAGDYVVVEDDPAGDTRPRLVMNSQFSSDSGAADLSVGAPPDYVDVLLARAGVVLSAAGVS